MPRILRSHSTGGSGGAGGSENTTSFTSSLETAINNNTTNNNMNNNSTYNKYSIFDTSPVIYTTSTTTNTNTEPYTPYTSSLSPLNIPPPPPQTSPINSISTDSYLEEEKGRENSRESGRDKMFRSLGILSATSSTSVVYDKDMVLAPSASVGGAVVGPPRLTPWQSSDSTPVYTYAGDGKWLIDLFVCARCCLLLFIAHVVHVLYKCTFTHHIHYMAFLHQYITYSCTYSCTYRLYYYSDLAFPPLLNQVQSRP